MAALRKTPFLHTFCSCGQLKNLSHVTVLPLGPFPDVWPEHITRYSRLHGMLSTAIEQRQILCSFHGRYAPERRMFMKALELLPEEFACTKRVCTGPQQR